VLKANYELHTLMHARMEKMLAVVQACVYVCRDFTYRLMDIDNLGYLGPRQNLQGIQS
jgi:hypothetical protein